VRSLFDIGIKYCCCSEVGREIDAGETSTALEIIDARVMDGPPVASIRLPHRVPPGIHGKWLQTKPKPGGTR